MKNIYQESDGVFRIELSNGFRDDGTRDRIVERVYGTPEEAIKRRDELKALQKQMREEGLKAENGGYTLTQTSKIYLDDTKYQKRSLTTTRGYKQLLNNWILPELGDIKIRSITEQDLEKLYDKMRNSTNAQTGKKLSETYVNHCHKLITSIFNYAKKKKWLLSNPAEFVINPPKLKIKQRDYYNYEEMMEVFELLKSSDIRFRTAIFTLFNTGFRRGELGGLKWKDISKRKMPITENGVRKFQTTYIISVEREIMTVSKEMQQDPNFLSRYDIIEQVTDSLVAIKPKTDKSTRKVVVVDEVYDTFMEYKKFQIDNGYTPNDEDYIFRTQDLSSVWHPDYITKEWARFIKVNDLKPITVHDIRHSHATYLLSIGVPPQDVARRLGHSEPSTTLRIYTHSNLIQDQKIVSMIANNIFNNDDIPNVEVQPLTLLSILTNDPKLANEDDLFNTLEWFSHDNITHDDLDSYMSMCKQYILDTNPNLQDFNQAIESIDPKLKGKLLGGIFAIFDNDHELSLNPISDISKYKDENISI
ncbi:MAG: site-specific integrase [Bacilli bacterium]|nr:site-specific integrase [Bacilli bacterium]